MSKGLNIIAGLRLNTSAFTTSLKGATASLGKFSAAGSKGMGGLATTSNLVTIGVIALALAFKNMLGIVMDFSKSLSELQAVSGATDTELKRLSEQAQELGSRTVHTATEVLKLQTALSRLGFKATQIENMTEAILHLGTAMGIELKDAADLTGSTLRAFGLEANQAQRVVDVLAKSTTISSLSFDKLKIALPYAATAAKQAGYSFERTSAMLAILANSGLRASTIGTSMRKIFIKLSQKGLTLNQALGMINKSTNKMSTATSLFGVTAANSALILADNTNKIEEYNGAMEDASGTTDKMAKIMADNLSGDVTLAKSAWESFVLAVDEGDGVISRALRSITKEVTGMLSVWKSYADGTDYYETGAKKILEQADAQKLLNTETKKLKDSYKGPEEAISNITALFDENAESQKRIDDLSKRSLANIIPAIAKANADKIRSLKTNILTNNALIGANRNLIASEGESVVSMEKVTDAIIEETEAEKDARLSRERWLKLHDKSIITLQTLTDKWYLLTLTGKEYKDEKFSQWYDAEKKALDKLTLSTDEYKKSLEGLNEAAKIKRGKDDIIDPISGKTTDKPDIAGDILAIAPVPTEAPEKLITFNELLKESFNAVSALSGAFDILGDAISGAVEGQEQSFAKMTVGVLKSVNKIINALLAELIISAITSGTAKGGIIGGLVAGAIGVPLLIGVVNSSIDKNKQNFALGGIVPGTSFSGDNITAGLNSKEMVLTQAQQANLFAMANGAGGAGGGSVEFEIRGDKLVGVLSNYNRKISKTR